MWQVAWVGYEFNPNDPTNTGALYRTADITQNPPVWVLSGQKVLPKRHCNRIVVDPNNRNRVYALYGGYERSNLFRTEDGGENWTPLGQNKLPEAPVFDLAVHPDDSKILVLGTEVGLFVSNDSGLNWSPTNQGPTNAAVYQLFWADKTLAAVTHGRGIFTIDLSQATHAQATRFSPLDVPPKAIAP